MIQLFYICSETIKKNRILAKYYCSFVTILTFSDGYQLLNLIQIRLFKVIKYVKNSDEQ